MATAIDTAVRSQQDADPLDRALVRAKAGDEDAFRDLVEAISPEVTRWLLRGHCPDEDSASAVLQDAWMTSWVRITTFDSTTSLRRWVCRVAANNAITVLRRGRRERSVLAEVAHDAHPSALRDVTWEPDQHREPDAESVENVIERLPSRYRSLAVLAFVHGCRPAEVAELLRRSRPGVKMRLHRLRALLRGRLRAADLSRTSAARDDDTGR